MGMKLNLPYSSQLEISNNLIIRLVLLFFVPLVLVVSGVLSYALGGGQVSTENAYVRNDVVAVSTEIDGRVLSVNVNDNQSVQTGELLFEMDSRPLMIEIEAIEAEIAMVEQNMASVRAEYDALQADIAVTEERIRYLITEHTRHQKLVSSGHSSKTGLEAAAHELETAKRSSHALQKRKLKLIAELGGALNKPNEQHPAYLRAAADLKRVRLDLSRTKVYSPVDGIVGTVPLQAGEQLDSGDTVFPIVVSHDPWVEANLKEVHLTHVRVGQNAEIHFDSYPDQSFQGKVDSISPATGAEFSLLPPQNTTGNWVKVVQWVPVKIRILAKEDIPALRPGLTATVKIETGYERPLGVFVKQKLDWLGLNHEWWPRI